MRIFKKGLEAHILGEWIIGLIGLVVLIFAVYAISKSLAPNENFQKLSECKLTIQALSESQGNILGLLAGDSNIEFNCETNWYGSLNISSAKDDDEVKDKMLSQISPLMRDCWYQFGEGKLDPFRGSWKNTDHICFVCSRFIYPNTTVVLKNSDFYDYFINHKDSLSKKQYSAYFANAFFGYPLLFNITPSDVVDLNHLFSLTPDAGSDLGMFYVGQAPRENDDYAVIIYSFAPTKALASLGIGEAVYKTAIVRYDMLDTLSCSELKKKPRVE